MDDTDCEDREEKRGQLVPLPGRRRVEKRTHDDRADGATGLVDAAFLTPAERAVLFGVPPIDGATPAAAVMAAATGLVKLAAQHVARRLTAPEASTLTAQDRIAMAIVPTLAVQLRQQVRTPALLERPEFGGHDPILALLEEAESPSIEDPPVVADGTPSSRTS